MTIEIITTILAILGCAGSVYLYFINKKLRSFDTERDLKIAKAELELTQQTHKREDNSLKEEYSRSFKNRHWDAKTESEIIREYEEKLTATREKQIPEETKKEAEVERLENYKNYGLLFLKKSKKHYDPIFIFKPSWKEKFIKWYKTILK